VLASFLGRSQLQYLIAYSMQIRRGKAWEISSHPVKSGRQMVDTRGAVPDSSNCRFVSNCPWRYERQMVLWGLQDSSSGTTPRVSTFCLPDVTTCDQISQAFPLRICMYCKRSNTGGGNGLGMRLFLCVPTYHMHYNYITYIVAMRPYFRRLWQFRQLLSVATVSSLAQLRI